MNRDVRLRVEGSLLERLIQRALTEGAHFDRVRRIAPRVMLVDTDERSAEILRSICERCWLDCRVLRRGGFAALGDVLRARWTLLPGLLLCAAVCALFLSRIWLVDVRFTGPCAELGDDAALRKCLAREGIRVGMSAAGVDAKLLRSELLADAGDFSYIGVRRQGVRLLVEAAPEVPAPQVYERDYARDLVAARDGVIESVTVRSGHAAVKPGDTVRAGQLLIRGEESATKEETVPVGASGSVIARCWCEASAEGALADVQLQRTGNARVESALRLFGRSIPLSACEAFDSEETQVELLPVVGLFLPLEVNRRVHWETAPVRVEADPAKLEAQLAALAEAKVRATLARTQIDWALSTAWTDATREGDLLRVRAVYEITTDIAVTRDELQSTPSSGSDRS